MYKKFIASFCILLILTLTPSPPPASNTETAAASVTSVTPAGTNLVLDTTKYDVMPKNFRKSSDLINIGSGQNLNFTGLSSLNASGSSQFSGENLSLLIDAIATPMHIVDIDLRQESHGFINGLPVSWANEKNDANIGMSFGQVLKDESSKLRSIKLGVPLSFYNHPQISVVPKKVENESRLAGSKGLSYVRIPVTDGKIPTDDMVDCFVSLIKALPTDTWLHFHCKEGVGRTTTFMIMYDMMRNYKNVSADDIINRQLLLDNFDESGIKSFENQERLTFLKSFYEYCKQNGDSFDIKWSYWKNSPRYINNPTAPTSLYVIPQDKLTAAERTMIASLQGLANFYCSSQIYTLSTAQPDYKIWLEDLKNNYGVSYKIISDPWKLLDIYKDRVDGYVLYSRKAPNDPSINNACSFAALNNCLVVDEAIEAKVKLHGITKLKADCRNTEEAWAYERLWAKGLNHSLVIQLSPAKDAALRDYAIMSKSLVFYEASADNTTLRDKIFSSMEGNALCLGWGPDEFINVSTASKHGVSVVAADWSYNLTVLSAFRPVPAVQKAAAALPKDKNVHYVTFVMSDGDNQQWYLGTNYSSPRWYGSPLRGCFNLGWSISPSLYYLAPTVFNLYYKSASGGSFNDYFIVAPSGNGYMYPSKYEKSKLDGYVEELNAYMEKADEKYVAIIDDSSFYDKKLWDTFTAKPNIEGLFYLDYDRHDNYHGAILWSNGKPVVACRDLLWKGLESGDELVKAVDDRVGKGQTNAENPDSYTFVYVHVWSKNTGDVAAVVNKLKKNPRVRVVTPEVFMELIKTNVRH